MTTIVNLGNKFFDHIEYECTSVTGAEACEYHLSIYANRRSLTLKRE